MTTTPTLRNALGRATELEFELAIDNVDIYGIRATRNGTIEISCLDATSTRGVIDTLDVITNVFALDSTPLPGLAIWTGTWRATTVEVVGYQHVDTITPPPPATTVEGKHCCKCRGEGVVDVDTDGYDDTATCWWCGGSGVEPIVTVNAGAA